MPPWTDLHQRDGAFAHAAPIRQLQQLQQNQNQIQNQQPSWNDDGNVHELHTKRLHALNVASLSLASLSVGVAILASYWFIRMRRSFRHDLIMLLIQTDMFKAIWFMIFPIVQLINGTVESDSIFCQTSGFFLAVGIEASDVAVAMIAIHSALYIFRGEQGLYPYRKIAYTVFVILPLMLASLAFINKPAYFNSGEYCYLPMHPDWARRAFSWIPRYVTFATILFTYGTIYIYVRILMRRFGAVNGKRQAAFTRLTPHTLGSNKKQASSVPPTPPIAYHGLIASTNVSRRNSREDRDRLGSVSTMSTMDVELPPAASTDLGRAPPLHKATQERDFAITWRIPNFGFDSTVPPYPYRERLNSEPDLSNALTSHYSNGNGDINTTRRATLGAIHVEDTGVSPLEPKQSNTLSPTQTHTQIPLLFRAFQSLSLAAQSETRSRAGSQTNIFAILRRGPRSSGASTLSSSVYYPPSELDAPSMVKTREKIRRQLRQLFIYPLVYIVVWIMPFINHIIGWDGGKAPFGMVLMGLISLCIQGFVDATVFSLKEQPWRHLRKKGQGPSIRFWGSRSQEGINPNVGRTREEMLVDGRIARRRREDELAQLKMNRVSARKPHTEWWDHVDEGSDDMV